jgi:hypothetical protein
LVLRRIGFRRLCPAPQRVAAAMAPTITATNAVRYSMLAMSVTTIVLR